MTHFLIVGFQFSGQSTDDPLSGVSSVDSPPVNSSEAGLSFQPVGMPFAEQMFLFI